MHKGKSNKIFFFVFTALILVFIICLTVSCNNDTGENLKQGSSGVISLFDSLGIGDVPPFPGSRFDVDLYRSIDSVLLELPEMPELFSESVFSTYITKSSPDDVNSYYSKKMKELEWEFIQTYDYEEEGSFTTWQKMANTGKYVTLGIYTGNYLKNNKRATLILNGFVIPKDDESFDEPGGIKQEGAEPEGIIYFENPTPPQGQGLLLTKPVSAGIEGWKIWLQEGSNEKGINEANLVNDRHFGNVVKFQRSSNPDDGGAAGIYQEIDIPVSHFKSLYIWLVGKIDNENGGNIANTSPQWFPEGAIQISIKYIDTCGASQQWYHGFYYSRIKNPDSLHFTRINKGDYFWYIGPDLMAFENKPEVIKEIRVYGFGWDFSSSLAEINLIAQ
ncbi:MAG: hypothetical protein JW997_00050 [Actinobacteria bacterium]|nr:hypothetical protein [Actinomycetota bacterium]